MVYGSGEPIVAIHGWGTHGAVWEDIAEELTGSYSLLAVDLPGFGRSALPEGDYSLRRLTDGVATVAPSRAVWLGWSMGGLVAMHAAYLYPELVGALVLIATTPRFVRCNDWVHAVSPDILEAFAADLMKDPAGTLVRFLVLQAGRGERARAVVKHLRTQLFRHGTPSRAALAGGLAVLQAADLRAELASITCPTLLILGGRDTLVPSATAADIKYLRPDWTVELIDKSAHAPFLSHPAQFHTALGGFLHA